MKEKNDPKQFNDLEAKLGKLSRVTLSQTFPSWEELSKREIKFPELYEVPKSRSNVFAFPIKKTAWLGTGLLTAAAISIVFILNRTPNVEPTIAMEEVSPAFASVSGPVFEPVLGSITQSKGKNFLRNSAAEEMPLNKGNEIAIGDRILVGKAGILDIVFSNKVYMRVLGETEIEIVDSKSMLDSTQQLIRILKGKVLVTIGKLKKDSSFQIASGEINTFVRGTTFSVRYDGKNTQTISVREGSVSVVSSEHAESILEPGKQILFMDKLASETSSISPKDDKEMKALQTQVALAREAKLYADYSRLELVRMEDGTEYHGVILGQTATHLQFESVDGSLEIPIGKILETEKIR